MSDWVCDSCWKDMDERHWIGPGVYCNECWGYLR